MSDDKKTTDPVDQTTADQPSETPESDDQEPRTSPDDDPKPEVSGDTDQDASARVAELEARVAELKDKNLRLYADFENLRRRTAKERLELMQTAGKDVILSLLPVLDDLERAAQSIGEATDASTAREGFDLIRTKLMNQLTQKGLQPMDAQGEDFDAEKHEAVTEIPAPSEDMKGKVVDEIEKGYLLNDRIIRFAKVVVGK